ncbi:hypothetical protein, partial [Pseudonocardia sp.]|uniref:hypothetical protein n=1 Tax=Pseudonocardia sp. TaxID=60912 RepID=UPI002617009F
MVSLGSVNGGRKLTPWRLLAAAEGDDGGVIGGDDVVGVSRPRRRGAGRGLVVGVARSWSSRRVG